MIIEEHGAAALSTATDQARELVATIDNCIRNAGVRGQVFTLDRSLTPSDRDRHLLLRSHESSDKAGDDCLPVPAWRYILSELADSRVAPDAVEDADQSSGILVVRAKPLAGREQEFIDFYTKRHIPELLSAPGFASCRLYRVADQTQTARHDFVSIWTLHDRALAGRSLGERRGKPELLAPNIHSDRSVSESGFYYPTVASAS